MAQNQPTTQNPRYRMTYYIARNSDKKAVYHKHKECHQLLQSKVREATETHLERYRPCKVCITGEQEEADNTEWMKFTKQLRANPEQFK